MVLKLISCGHSLWEFNWYPPLWIIIVLKPVAILDWMQACTLHLIMNVSHPTIGYSRPIPTSPLSTCAYYGCGRTQYQLCGRGTNSSQDKIECLTSYNWKPCIGMDNHHSGRVWCDTSTQRLQISTHINRSVRCIWIISIWGDPSFMD